MKDQSTKIGGILAKLFKKIVHDLNGDSVIVQNNVISSYILTKYEEAEKDPEVKIPLKGNLRNYLSSPNLTFKRFIECMDIYKLRNFTIHIEIHHKNGKSTTHSIDVNINNIHDDGDQT